jgi:hypothetical protein
MSKKFRNELEAMDVDQVTAKLADHYEKYDRIMTDKKKGTVKTLFNASTLLLKECAILEMVAARKNGIRAEAYSAAEGSRWSEIIASAAEVRGNSQAVASAAKIRKHIQLEAEAEKAAYKALYGVRSPLKRAKIFVAAYKNFG